MSRSGSVVLRHQGLTRCSRLFNTHSARWRSLQVLLMGVFGQFSGNGLGYFNTEIYKAVGYDTDQQFDLNLANSFTSAIGAGFGVALADKMPRRTVLVWGTFVCSIMLALNGGFSAAWAHESDDQKNLNSTCPLLLLHALSSILIEPSSFSRSRRCGLFLPVQHHLLLRLHSPASVVPRRRYPAPIRTVDCPT